MTAQDCTATGFTGEGRCIEPAAEDGLCSEHAARGASRREFADA